MSSFSMLRGAARLAVSPRSVGPARQTFRKYSTEQPKAGGGNGPIFAVIGAAVAAGGAWYFLAGSDSPSAVKIANFKPTPEDYQKVCL